MSNDDHKGKGDKAAERDRAPLKNPQVDVEVKPKSGKSREERRDNSQYADKVSRNIEKEVKKAVEEAGKKAVEQGSPAPKKEQFEAAKKAADDAAKQVSPSKVDRIKVNVAGKETVHTPGDGPPPDKKP